MAGETFGARLRELRLACGLHQTEVAERLGVDRASISRWESGDREPERLLLVALLDAYGLPDADRPHVLTLPRAAALHASPLDADSHAPPGTGPSQQITPDNAIDAFPEVPSSNPPIRPKHLPVPSISRPVATVAACAACGGAGHRAGDDCDACLGTGRVIIHP